MCFNIRKLCTVCTILKHYNIRTIRKVPGKHKGPKMNGTCHLPVSADDANLLSKNTNTVP